MTGIELIAQEREEQIEKHNYTEDHLNNTRGELATAAQGLLEGDITWMPVQWGRPQCTRMVSKSYKDRLIIAGALIAAEIDRLNYKP